MHNFVKTIKSIFRKKKNEDYKEEKSTDKEATDANEKSQKKFTLSCVRKKKKRSPATIPTMLKKVTRKSHPPTAIHSPSKQQSTKLSPYTKMSAIKTKQLSIHSQQSTSTSQNTKALSLKTIGKVKMEPKAFTDSEYAMLPKEEAPRAIQSESYSNVESYTSQSDGGPSSIRRFKNFSARTLRKVKTFVSRPMNEATLRKVAYRVEQRKAMENQTSTHTLRHGEDIFPKQKPSSTLQNTMSQRKKKSSHETVFPQVNTQTENKDTVKVGVLSSGTILVKNNDNNGKLFVEKKSQLVPFWTASVEDDSESETETNLQLNAEIVLDVMNGKVELAKMPTIPILLDPSNDLADLKKRDSLFFNRDVLFGNTVRTMINLSDQISVRGLPRRKNAEKNSPLNIVEPDVYTTYKKGEWTTFRKEKIRKSEN